ncbi:hypothetical protein EPN96_12250 [bacterium]|nr:MAG: hypothetical protein EPN96_12250 [bacterium]
MGRKTVTDLDLKNATGGLDPVKVAKIRVVMGVPGLVIGVLAPVVIFKKLGFPLAGAPFWIAESVVIAVFTVYFLWVGYSAWKEKRELSACAPEGAFEEGDEEAAIEDEADEDGSEY